MPIGIVDSQQDFDGHKLHRAGLGAEVNQHPREPIGLFGMMLFSEISRCMIFPFKKSD
jgi:hypothetical protein